MYVLSASWLQILLCVKRFEKLIIVAFSILTLKFWKCHMSQNTSGTFFFLEKIDVFYWLLSGLQCRKGITEVSIM